MLQVLLLVVRWAFAIAALALAVHFAPTHRRVERWVELGTLVVVGSWIVMSLLFGTFVT